MATLWSMCAAFADADHQLGGGYARATLIHYDDVVAPLLLDGRYTDAVGRNLFAAAARLCDVAGFMCFDSGSPGLAQRYYIQALRMAKISGDRALGANILVDMSMQAHHERNPDEAVRLAEAAIASATGTSPSTLARCYAVYARGLALRGEPMASDLALGNAEKVLTKAEPSDEPFWIRFFTPQQLATESMYVSSDLSRDDHVRRHAPFALGPATDMQRRHVLATATLATSYLPDEGPADVDRACDVLGNVCTVMGSLRSARSLDAVNRVRARLASYADEPAVKQFEATFQLALAA